MMLATVMTHQFSAPAVSTPQKHVAKELSPRKFRLQTDQGWDAAVWALVRLTYPTRIVTPIAMNKPALVSHLMR